MDTDNETTFPPLEPGSMYIIYPYDVNSWQDAGTQEATISPLVCKDGMVRANSSIICEEIYEELDLEAEDNCVTIVIYDGSATAESDDASLRAPEAHIASSTATPENVAHIRKSLKECLKMVSGQGVEVCCFLCPKAYPSFNDLQKHFTEAHKLTQNIPHLSNLPSEYINLVAKEINRLECSCIAFTCTTCEGKFSHILQLVQHVLVNHPTTYGSFPFFTEQKQSGFKICQQCTVLRKLCHIDYDLFVKILLDCSECSDENCAVLLKSWPLADCHEPCIWCAEEGEDEEVRGSELGDEICGTKREVICYRMKLMKKCSQKAAASMCICPILKCPDCPKTVANFADLCKHIRLNSHSSWHDMKILWEKHKFIKDNCSVCPKYSYHCYILCPHCPHLAFDSEKAAQAHMDLQHNQIKNKVVAVCTCPNHYACFKCSTFYPTPQSLHHHLQLTQHTTEENLAAIPAMIQRSIKGRKGCPRCLLQDSGNTPGSHHEQDCSCRWVECSICKTSFRKVSSFLDHIDKAKHTMSDTEIRREKEKLACSVKTCRRCCGIDKYCMLCQQRQNFLHTHLRTRHQDQQIMLLQDDSGAFLEEIHTPGWDKGRLARYECSVCLQRFPCINKLRHHVCQQHPCCYFSVFCLDLSNDVLQVKDFAAHEEVMILNIVNKGS